MRLQGFSLKVFWMWAVLAPSLGFAQIQGAPHAIAGVDAAGNAETVEAALHQMSDRAAVIFVGTVAEVRRAEGVGGGAVEVQFSVEQGIRGCSGGTYTLREWSGLWSANDSRYRVGQRLLMLLHAPSSTGLSSPVGGMDGAIPVRASGVGVKATEGSTAVAEQVADLRWVGARLARTVVYKSSKPTAMAMGRSAGSAFEAADEAMSAAVNASSTPVQQSAVSSVISMIQSWEVKSDATR